MSTSGMHGRPFEGRHLVTIVRGRSTNSTRAGRVLWHTDASIYICIATLWQADKFCGVNCHNCDTMCNVEVLIMHPRHPGMHMAIDSLLLILTVELKFFLCADMFPYEDFEIVSICLSVRLSVPRENKSP